jgi:hypothetical protein
MPNASLRSDFTLRWVRKRGSLGMMRVTVSRLLIIGAIAAVMALPPASQAQLGGEQLTSSWANLNICSSTQLGARAQLAGDGSANGLYVRFTAQWLSPSGWVALNGAASSPWQYAGSAEYTWGQAGWTFAISVPPGQNYQMRALAELQWRGAGGRSETRVTGGCTVGG